MADLIDRKELRDALYEADAVTMQGVKIINQFPAVNAVPVVRCRECKYSTLPSSITQKYGVPGTLTCHNRYSPCNNRNVSGEGFCPYGERKDGGE